VIAVEVVRIGGVRLQDGLGVFLVGEVLAVDVPRVRCPGQGEQHGDRGEQGEHGQHGG
jgi:hypothetical protein